MQIKLKKNEIYISGIDQIGNKNESQDKIRDWEK